MNTLSHIDSQGRACMVDVGEKEVQVRVAKACGFIRISVEALALIREKSIKKGDVLTVAKIAGMQAARSTAGLIPLCHNLPVNRIVMDTIIEKEGISISSEIHSTGRTGVEMEALTAVSVGLLTIYDMCKAVDKNMEIGRIKLLSKCKTPVNI